MTFSLLFDGKFGTYLVADTLATRPGRVQNDATNYPDALTTGLALSATDERVRYTEDALKLCNFGHMALGFAGDGQSAHRVMAFLSERLKAARDFNDRQEILQEAFAARAPHKLQALGMLAYPDGFRRWDWDISGGKIMEVRGKEDMAIGSGADSAKQMLNFTRTVTPHNSDAVSECSFFCDHFLMAQVGSERHRTIDVGIGGVATAIHRTDAGFAWAPERTTYVFYGDTDLKDPLELLLIYKSLNINGTSLSLSLTRQTDDVAVTIRRNPASEFVPAIDIPKLSFNSPFISICIFRGWGLDSSKVRQMTFNQPGTLWNDEISVNFGESDFDISISYESHPDMMQKLENLLQNERTIRY
ncbi:hypothetical protein ACC732_04445 [Rhizobium ruizarguesonis]